MEYGDGVRSTREDAWVWMAGSSGSYHRVHPQGTEGTEGTGASLPLLGAIDSLVWCVLCIKYGISPHKTVFHCEPRPCQTLRPLLRPTCPPITVLSLKCPKDYSRVPYR